MKSYKDEKLDIIVLAGQSNAFGHGISSDGIFETRNDVYELIDFNNFYLKDDKLHIILPVECKVQCLQDRYMDFFVCADMSISFVDEFRKSKFYDPTRKIIVIKCAVGGTGFARKEWGVNAYLYKRSLDMIDLALSFNKDNRIVAYLWHQGECDSYENAQFSEKERYDFYTKEFMNQMTDLRKRYSQFNFPIISGEFCDEWSNLPENIKQTQVVERALRDCSKQLGNATVVSSEGLKSNNQTFGNGDNIHFSKDSQIQLGKRYFAAFEELKKNN